MRNFLLLLLFVPSFCFGSLDSVYKEIRQRINEYLFVNEGDFNGDRERLIFIGKVQGLFEALELIEVEMHKVNENGENVR